MTDKTKVYVTTITAFFVLSLALASLAMAAGSITLTPNAQAQSGSVSVAGTAFAATKAVAIALGGEVSASQSNMPYSGSAAGPYGGTLAYRPIKPGSFKLTSDTTAGGGVVTDYTDNGDGTLSSTSAYFVAGTINYVTGQWSRTSSIDLTGIDQIYSATYTRYDYNVTPAAGVTTLASGAFTASITVPAAVANGNYNVTAIDTSGNKAVSVLNVNSAIPEVLPLGTVVLLSLFAALASARYFQKRPRIQH
jgi:hypothetical protein